MGNFIELENKYGLLKNFNRSETALREAVDILKNTSSKDDWRKQREQLLKEKIDVTDLLVWFVENYPESLSEMDNYSGSHQGPEKHQEVE